MAKQIKVTKKNLLEKLKFHSLIELKFQLAHGLVSRHTITLSSNLLKIVDHSHVDEIISRVLINDYFSGWYGEQIKKGLVFYE